MTIIFHRIIVKYLYKDPFHRLMLHLSTVINIVNLVVFYITFNKKRKKKFFNVIYSYKTMPFVVLPWH